MIPHKEPLERPHLELGLLFHLRGGPLGRRTLVERTHWTESVVRTELEKLEALGWVEFAKPGTFLSDAASFTLDEFFARVPRVAEIELIEMGLDRAACGALVRGVTHTPKTWQVRDAAVREGATGILLLTREPSGLKLTDVDASFSRRNAHDAARVEAALGPSEVGDWVVIVFAGDAGRASAGLWRALSGIVPPPALDRAPRSHVRLAGRGAS